MNIQNRKPNTRQDILWECFTVWDQDEWSLFTKNRQTLVLFGTKTTEYYLTSNHHWVSFLDFQTCRMASRKYTVNSPHQENDHITLKSGQIVHFPLSEPLPKFFKYSSRWHYRCSLLHKVDHSFARYISLLSRMFLNRSYPLLWTKFKMIFECFAF